jgi:uncharacterized Rossmann fold enzyme
MENELKNIVLDLSANDISDLKVTTKYCVEQDVHDHQVKLSIGRGYESIPASEQIKYDPIAVVCSGPSLKETWSEVKKFSRIISCSGAHDFLIERGIIPTYHMEADPRKHKSLFVKNPHKDVQYLIASCCHPAVFESLDGYNVKLWHVLGKETANEIPAIYPPGHWVLTGGSNVGLRALVMARVLGHTNVHVFGMDCSSDTKQFHANAHPNEPKNKAHRCVKIGKREFVTTEVFLEYARQFFKEIAMIPDTQFVLHGDGLLQNLAVQKFSDPEEVKKRMIEMQSKIGKAVTIALLSPKLISPQYAEQNKKLHQDRPDYGCSGRKRSAVVQQLAISIDAKTVLDYGCGKGELAKGLSFPIWEYDPAIAGKEMPPRPADLVVCTDVLEHIEPEYLDAVLMDLARCTMKIGYFVIHMKASSKTLPDGRNAHLIQKGRKWWSDQLAKYFHLADGAVMHRPPELHIVVSPKQNTK